jgi:hypothetical protein
LELLGFFDPFSRQSSDPSTSRAGILAGGATAAHAATTEPEVTGWLVHDKILSERLLRQKGIGTEILSSVAGALT